jgi:hypothetical protein
MIFYLESKIVKKKLRASKRICKRFIFFALHAIFFIRNKFTRERRNKKRYKSAKKRCCWSFNSATAMAR